MKKRNPNSKKQKTPSTPADRVDRYAADVIAGRVVAGPYVRLACKRHEDDRANGAGRGLSWKESAADSAIKFFEECLNIDEGKPFKLHDFQAFIIGSLFGWYNADGFRRFRTAYNEMGKGNGKTPLAAGIGLYGLVVDEEPAPEIYSAATTREQAGICFKDAYRIVGISPELSCVDQHAGSLTIEDRYAVFRALSSEHRGLDGKRPHIAIVDELHEHPSAIVVDKIRAGTKSRRNALIFEITNSGFDRHSVCWNHREYSIKVLEGTIKNDAWFAYVCALDENDKWQNPDCWLKANPGLGTILPESYLREQVAEAEGMPTKENIVKRLNFCIWTEQENRAIPMHVWDSGAEPFDAEALRGRDCYAGLDLAKVSDLSAFVLVFPPVAEGEKWKALAYFWCPEEDVHQRSRRDRVPYDVWVREKLMIATPGNTTDYEFIKTGIMELAGKYNIKEIACDRTFGGEIIQWLLAEGITIFPFGQGFMSMDSPTCELLRMLKSGELQHGGHTVLRWNASNLATAEDAAGNIKPDKEKSREKIDGITALIMGLGRAKLQPLPFAGGDEFAIAKTTQ